MTQLYDRLIRAEAIIAGTFLILMVVMIFTGGIARLARSPLNWTTDVATCLFAWACFLAADIAWRRNAMMSIEVLTARLPERGRFVLGQINYVLIVVFLAYLAVRGIELAWVSRVRNFQGIPWVSYSWVTLSLPIGALLLLMTTFGKIRAAWRGETMADQSVDVL